MQTFFYETIICFHQEQKISKRHCKLLSVATTKNKVTKVILNGSSLKNLRNQTLTVPIVILNVRVGERQGQSGVRNFYTPFRISAFAVEGRDVKSENQN